MATLFQQGYQTLTLGKTTISLESGEIDFKGAALYPDKIGSSGNSFVTTSTLSDAVSSAISKNQNVYDSNNPSSSFSTAVNNVILKDYGAGLGAKVNDVITKAVESDVGFVTAVKKTITDTLAVGAKIDGTTIIDVPLSGYHTQTSYIDPTNGSRIVPDQATFQDLLRRIIVLEQYVKGQTSGVLGRNIEFNA